MGLEITLEGVSKSFGTNEFSIRDINLKIKSGEIVALVGDSGSGKTTILNFISGIDRPQSGKVRLGKKILRDMSEEEVTKFRRTNLGFVFQSFHLIPHLNVFQNIIFPCLLLNFDLQTSNSRVQQYIDKIGLSGRNYAFPDQLSGGEQQRVAIARALIHEPNLILADEPTGNLDSMTSENVLNFLIDQCRTTGATLLMVTHSDQAAKKMTKKFFLSAKGLSES